MQGAQPKRELQPEPQRQEVPHIYAVEATGLIVIALVIVVLTLIRYWHHIPWSAR